MTVVGTYRSGARVTTAAELDALPAESLVRADGEVYERIEGEPRVSGETWRCLHEPDGRYSFVQYPATTVLAQGEVKVLFRPDAPQPAPTDDVVERVARALYDVRFSDSDMPESHWRDLYPHYLGEARAALAAAGASTSQPAPNISQSGSTGEAVDREARVRVQEYVRARVEVPDWFASDVVAVVPEMTERDGVRPHDEVPLMLADLLALLAARGDAAPTVTAEQVREACEDLVDSGQVPVPDDASPWEYVSDAIAGVLAALGIEVTP